MKVLIELALVIALMAYSAGNLPNIVRSAKKAQLYLLKDSSSSSWGKAWIPKLGHR